MIVGMKASFLALMLYSSCQSAATNTSADQSQGERHDLKQRVEITLPQDLLEVSGQTFLGNDAIRLYMIQDENGILYKYNLETKTIEEKIQFAGDADYEDISTDEQYFYVLQSNGHVYRFPVNASGAVQSEIFKNLIPKAEYESMYYHQADKKLYILCKSCKGDRKQQQSTGYILETNASGDLVLAGQFAIDLNKAQAIHSKFPKTFEPSAMSYYEQEGEWYILSSIDKMILVTDKDFNPKRVMKFSRKDYEQPEGLSFDKQGNLYISSEAGEEKDAKLYIIKP